MCRWRMPRAPTWARTSGKDGQGRGKATVESVDVDNACAVGGRSWKRGVHDEQLFLNFSMDARGPTMVTLH